MVAPTFTFDGSKVTITNPGLKDQVLNRVHPARQCEGEFCILHNPSDHPMRDLPLQYRVSWGHLTAERFCPHGVGHPDPDDVRYLKTHGDPVADLHGCDGCCAGTDYSV